jgi:hypothetical protein
MTRSLIPTIAMTMLLAPLVACGSASDDAESQQASAPPKSAPEAAKPQDAPPASGPAALRARLTEGVGKATVMRVEGAGDAIPGERLAGYLVRPGSERPLSPELAQELVTLVRSSSGFDDEVMKRCPPGDGVGFRLARQSNAPASELVLDFGCNRLSLAEAGGEIQSTYFDPSRSAFVSFVKRALPDDSEVGALE